jgi:hypothetical protein
MNNIMKKSILKQKMISIHLFNRLRIISMIAAMEEEILKELLFGLMMAHAQAHQIHTRANHTMKLKDVEREFVNFNFN